MAAVWIIWALNAPLGWPAKVGHVLAATTLAWLVPGLFGIEAINAFLTLAIYTVPIEGFILGWKLYGWPGAVAGVLAGLVLSLPIGVLATALTSAFFYSLGSIGIGR